MGEERGQKIGKPIAEVKTPAVETERTQPSTLEEYISQTNDLSFSEVEMSRMDPDSQQLGGVARDEQNHLVFDTDLSNEKELSIIDGFLQAYETGGKEAVLADSRFGWYFELQGDNFFAQLADVLRARRATLRGEDPANFGLHNLDFDIDGIISSAADLMRTMAQREMARTVIENQLDFLPIKTIKLKNGKQVPFSAAEIFSKKGAQNAGNLDWIYTTGPDGMPELVISSQYGIDTATIAGNSIDEIKGNGKFTFTLPDDDSGKPRQKDEPLVLNLDQGGAAVRPIFARIRIIKQAISMDEELDQYLKDSGKKKKHSSHTPPSASSSSQPTRWQSQPSTYIRSG